MGSQVQRIYLCEGETECHLVKALIHAGLIKPGKRATFNVALRKAKSQLRKWGYGAHFVIIVDADSGPHGRNSQLVQNMKMLARHHKKTALIIQCDNLEDELANSCGITRQKLYRLFGASTASEFKKRFLRVDATHLIGQMKQGGFDIENLWQQSCRHRAIPDNEDKWLELDIWEA